MTLPLLDGMILAGSEADNAVDWPPSAGRGGQ